MKVLFIHQNFPGQFKHLAPALAAAGHDVHALRHTGKGMNGVTTYRYKIPRGTTPSIHPLAAKFLDEVKNDIDPARVFFPGKLSYAAYLRVLQVSACHVYLTYPFVLSWSCLEAMSAGCLVIGSATPPVQEVIEDGRNGVLTDFFDRQALVDRINACLSDPGSFASLRQQARETIVERYDLRRICLPRQIALVEAVAGDKESRGQALR